MLYIMTVARSLINIMITYTAFHSRIVWDDNIIHFERKRGGWGKEGERKRERERER